MSNPKKRWSWPGAVGKSVGCGIFSGVVGATIKETLLPFKTSAILAEGFHAISALKDDAPDRAVKITTLLQDIAVVIGDIERSFPASLTTYSFFTSLSISVLCSVVSSFAGSCWGYFWDDMPDEPESFGSGLLFTSVLSGILTIIFLLLAIPSFAYSRFPFALFVLLISVSSFLSAALKSLLDDLYARYHR